MGSGYSVEGQVIGKEKFGGLQIEVIPSHRRHLETWVLATEPGEPEQDGYGYRAGYHTPAQLGLKLSDKLRTYSNLDVPLKISDLARRISSDKIRLYAVDELITLDKLITLNKEGSCHSPPVVPEVPVSPQSNSRPITDLSLPIITHHTLSNITVQCYNPFQSPNFQEEDIRRENENIGEITRPYRLCQRSHERKPIGRRIGRQSKPGNPRAMGMAAGGKLIQDIVRDNNSAIIWNVQNAALMNVHILDPASCEEVTHIVQEPPLSAQAYMDAGLPFFVIEENVENRLDKGDFEQVVSVSEMDKKIGVTTEPSFDPNKPKMCEECSLRLCDCM